MAFLLLRRCGLEFQTELCLLLPRPVQVTQHPQCQLRLRVRRATSSGGHRVALAGLVVGHPDAVRLVNPGYGQFEAGSRNYPLPTAGTAVAKAS